MFSRLEILIGNKINILYNKKVIVFGVGGVGGYAVEILARSGIGSLTLVDYDIVNISNKNRQIIALDSTIGRPKVEVMKERINDFNKDCNVITINDKLTPDNIETFNLQEYDYIVDAIDMVTSKINLITYAHTNNIPCISSMGVGNRIGVPEFEVCDIYKTSGDGLAKVLRKKLRENNINSHTVVFCKNQAEPKGDTIGSIAYYPAIAGCMLSAKVIDDLLKGDN